MQTKNKKSPQKTKERRKYVALLQGINVGGNKKVSMITLCAIFESLGFDKVRTYINSGNILFETPIDDMKSLAKNIEDVLRKQLGFSVAVVLRTSENIELLNARIPDSFVNNTDQKTDILFLFDEFDSKDSLKLIDASTKVDTLMYVSGAIIWTIDRKQYARSGMKKFIGSVLYKNMTARNINTVRKLQQLLNTERV